MGRRWSEVIAESRARRRLRCWLGLPMRSELDPVCRSALSECLSLLWSLESGWSCPDWGREGRGWSAGFLSAVRRSGVWRSSWWFVVPVALQDAVGCWAIGPGLPEDVSAEFLSSLEAWRSDELHDLSAECLSEGLSGDRSEVVSEVSYLLGRRRRLWSAK